MEKSVLSVRLPLAVIERLKEICKSEKRSQSVMIELMIEGYGVKGIKQNTQTAPNIASPQLAKKVDHRRINLAEELAKIKGQ